MQLIMYSVALTSLFMSLAQAIHKCRDPVKSEVSCNVCPHEKIFTTCELAKEFYWYELASKRKLPQWVCLADLLTGGNPNTITGNRYGLFQIPCPEFCHVKKKGGKCHMKCEDLLDENLADDITCVKLIAKQCQCDAPWVDARMKCKGRRLPRLEKC